MCNLSNLAVLASGGAFRPKELPYKQRVGISNGKGAPALHQDGAAIGSAVLSLAFKLFWPALPFIDRVGLAFILCVAVGMLISRIQGADDHPRAIAYVDVDTATSMSFNLASVVITLMLTALYAGWW